MLLESLLDGLVDWQESLAGSPVHLANELATECVDDTCHRGCGTFADEVEVKHTLDGLGLHTAARLSAHCSLNQRRGNLLDKASCLAVEEGMLLRAQSSRGSLESADVVVG